MPTLPPSPSTRSPSSAIHLHMPSEERMSRRLEIPPFGYWDHSNEFPITQYFESARQAGLHRRHSFRKEPAEVFELPPNSFLHHYPHPQRRKSWEKRRQQQQEEELKLEQCWQGEMVVKGQMRQRRVCDVSQVASQGMGVAGRNPRAVDEDLYKIPPELLNQRRGKRVVLIRGLWRKCRELNCIY